MFLFNGDVEILLFQHGVGEVMEPQSVRLRIVLVPFTLRDSLHATIRLRLAVSFRTGEELRICVQVAERVAVLRRESRERKVDDGDVQSSGLNVEVDTVQSRAFLFRADAFDQDVTPVQISVLKLRRLFGDGEGDDDLECSACLCVCVCMCVRAFFYLLAYLSLSDEV